MSSSDSESEQEVNSNEVELSKMPPASPGKAKKKTWLSEDVRQLINAVMDQIPPRDLTPWDKFQVDFDTIDSKFTPEECRKKWELLINQARQYRTFQEVAQEMLLRHEVVNSTTSEWNKDCKRYDKIKDPVVKDSKDVLKVSKTNLAKSKKVRYPKQYPPRPKTGYTLFLVKKMGVLRAEGVPTNQIFSKVSYMWKALSDAEKQVYHNKGDKAKVKYLEDLKNYAEDHPNDEQIKALIQTEEKAVRKLAKKKGTSHADDSDVSNNHSITEYLVPNHRKRDLSDWGEDSKSLNSTLDSTVLSPAESSKSPKKKKVKKTEAVSGSSPAKRKILQDNDSSSSPTKSPGKKKRRKHWTAEAVFIEAKKEEYSSNHLDWSEEKIHSKLQGKFAKLRESKQEKYARLAQERNDS